jgi:hypothetical protein
MTEIPEHLRKRAAEARKKAEGSSEPAAGGEPAASASATGEGAESGAASKIPAHLLERSKSARQREADTSSGSGGTATAVAPAAAAVTAATASGPLPTMTGPAGHTQRLLTVVKAGSIQDIKAKPLDKVHTWPHLILVEFGSALFLTAFLTIFSIFVNAPLLRLADVNSTPNPSKAPWYFLGLQELLTMFHPMVAGGSPRLRCPKAARTQPSSSPSIPASTPCTRAGRITPRASHSWRSMLFRDRYLF